MHTFARLISVATISLKASVRMVLSQSFVGHLSQVYSYTSFFYNFFTMDKLDLTCTLDPIHHLESARNRKQTKEDYLQILSELDRLGILSYYNMIEISVLGHYMCLQSSLSSLCNAFSFIQATVLSRARCRKVLNEAAELSISVSRRIFLARNCAEW